jgi:hypothetical protein
LQNIKEEPETEPSREGTDGQDAETDKVPQDVSLDGAGAGSADENNKNDKTGNKAATINNSDKTEAEIVEGGDLQGLLTLLPRKCKVCFIFTLIFWRKKNQLAEENLLFQRHINFLIQ